MTGELISQKEINKIIEDLKLEGYTKEQAIKLQEDIVKTCFRDIQFWEEQYDRIRFDRKVKHKEKRETLNCVNKAIKEHLKQIQILDALKEVLL